MTARFWTEHLRWLSKSLMAQTRRARAGSKHTLIKGSSIEEALRRILRHYLPSALHIGTGQVANNLQETSPQVDILIYDRGTFPHLAVNEDGSVVVCCEPLYASVECKTQWSGEKVATHYKRLKNVESKRYGEYFGHPENTSGYFVFVVDALAEPDLSELQDSARCVCVYSLEAKRSWRSPFEISDFTVNTGNALELFLQDILQDCMRKCLPEIGSLEDTYEAVSKYFGWEKR